MKKVVLIFVAIFSLVACEKDEVSNYSREQLEGVWRIYDIERPDGKRIKDFIGLEKEAANCQKNNSYFSFKGNYFTMHAQIPVIYNNGDIDCSGSAFHDEAIYYSIKGSTIRGTADGESHNMYDILSLSENRLEIRANKEMVDLIVNNFPSTYKNVTSYSIRKALESRMILIRASNSY